ncbi:MAG: hypothetical protein ACJ71Z_00360 [Aeromicrobium sp.]
MRTSRAFPVLAAAAVAAAWLPFLRAPLTPDEGGFLLLGKQWAPGTSLYGHYWVDRPPLIIWLFSLCDSPSAVRLLGLTAAALTVLLSGVLARALAPTSRWVAGAAPLLAAVLVTSPMFGMTETDGELLALPLVMTGLVCVIAALRSDGAWPLLATAVAAGAFATAGAMVKQSIIDVFVFAVVAFLCSWRHIDRKATRAASFIGGSLVVLAVCVGIASARGTSPAELWNAVVTFRFDAAKVIGATTPHAISDRLTREIGAFVASGAAAILGTTLWALWRGRRRLEPSVARLAPAAAAMVTWELVVVALGGSYWLHYLIGLIPGLVVLVALAGQLVRARTVLTACFVLAIAGNTAAWVYRQVNPPVLLEYDARVASYLRSHADPADGVVVAFGHPNIVQASGLRSPYADLWKLPVRVHDPDLAKFRALISRPTGPRWLVVDVDPRESWRLDERAGHLALREHYLVRARSGPWRVLERDGSARSEITPG